MAQPAAAVRAVAKWTLLSLAAAVVVLVVLTLASVRPGDRSLWPARGAATVAILVVSHGYHSGLVLPRSQLIEVAGRRGHGALVLVGERFAGFDSLEIGWGDEGFYREVPTTAALTVTTALRALLWPGNPSVLHVVGIHADPRSMFPSSDMIGLELSLAGFEHLVDRLARSLAQRSGEPSELGRGLYGTSLFYRANGNFHLLRVCNHWVADLLDAAGVPTAPLPATLPAGLLLDLEWRAGLARLAPP